MAKKAAYDNESIQSLKGADRVRKRRALFSAPTGLKGASIPFLRFCPTLSMKPERAGAIKL